ncbi:unnamed protein product [Rotaria sp. Silwood2]|nr:unnamed protein product [Rotaria sp. Silwood2]CAF2588114.1 unnamed protein product [Rotaria sp. Silwood2]CAF2837634.1 unnamed protein product [Rotaria sp. Silwood2]CAF2999991.1 unnamed protein product [Rotaria sp. Silwood2]CAF3870097.1 unnamed protein product [Rotaria sp. Silwood2]
MSNFLNKLLGKDGESTSHSCSHKADVKCESGTCSTSITGGEKLGRKSDDEIVNINTDEQVIEGRTVQREGVNIKSIVSSDIISNVAIANQQKLNDLISKLTKIDAEIQREIDLIVARTHHQQEELLRKANEDINQIDTKYRLRLQKMVEEIDVNKAKQIAEIEKELNKLQSGILKAAKNDIDLLNRKAAGLKIDILQEAQSKVALQTGDITTQAQHLSETLTHHQSTGTTTIKTDVSAVATPNEIGSTETIEKICIRDNHGSASGAQRI